MKKKVFTTDNHIAAFCALMAFPRPDSFLKMLEKKLTKPLADVEDLTQVVTCAIREHEEQIGLPMLAMWRRAKTTLNHMEEEMKELCDSQPSEQTHNGSILQRYDKQIDLMRCAFTMDLGNSQEEYMKKMRRSIHTEILAEHLVFLMKQGFLQTVCFLDHAQLLATPRSGFASGLREVFGLPRGTKVPAKHYPDMIRRSQDIIMTSNTPERHYQNIYTPI